MYRRRQRYVKKRVTEVTIILPMEKGYLEVYFEYDKHIVGIMQQLTGQYRLMPVKHWEFRKERKEEIVTALRKKGLHVRLFKRKIDSMADPDAISVLGICPNCGVYGYVNRDGRCSKCR